jgi:hypothetical protein
MRALLYLCLFNLTKIRKFDEMSARNQLVFGTERRKVAKAQRLKLKTNEVQENFQLADNSPFLLAFIVHR